MKPTIYTPHIGENYFKEKIDKDSFLFVGGHHHCMLSNRVQKYKCTKNKCSVNDNIVCTYYEKKCPLFNDCYKLTNNPKYKETFNLKDEYINLIKYKFDENKCKMRINLSCETRYSIHDYVNNYKERTPNFIFKNIEEVRRKLKIEKDKIEFYKYLAFVNFVQEITTNEENDPEKIEPEYLDNVGNMPGFKRNFNLLEPSVIIVLRFNKIKDKILFELNNIEDPFIELSTLSENDKYYVLARKSSQLYQKYMSGEILSKYSNFIEKVRNVCKKDGKRTYKDKEIVGVIAYHLGEKNVKLTRKELCQILQNVYGFFGDEKIEETAKIINDKVRRLKQGNKKLKALYELIGFEN